MTYIITALCLRDNACVQVCPVECIVPGKPEAEWPWFYIDPDTCIDCGACVPECPFEAIFPEDEVPPDLVAKEGQKISRNDGSEVYDGHDDKGEAVHIEKVRTLAAGEKVDLRADIQPNYDYFKTGPGYKAIGK
ncbi:MAG TPA: ferredoxin family protein [Anaerolineales bacterium]|nr:ferredoxin family protein [Anaerolineales bacterium]